jgi:TolA-binding protein
MRRGLNDCYINRGAMRVRTKIRAAFAGGALLAIAVGPPSSAQAWLSASARAPILLAHLDEQNLPSAELPPGAAEGEWQRIPDSGPSPSPTVSPQNAPTPGGAEATPPDAPEEISVPANSGNPASGNGGGVAAANPADHGAPDAASTPAGPPPALDISTVTAAPDPADQPLAGAIASADTPALAASLRTTEQARQELAKGSIDGAMRTLARAVSIDPGNPYAYFFLGRAYAARRDFGEALTFFRRAEIGFGADPQWLGETISYEGICEEEQGQLSEAAASYQRALGAAPNNLIARVGYGRLAANLPNPAGMDAPPPPANDVAAPPQANLSAPAPEEAPPPPPPGPGSDSNGQ